MHRRGARLVQIGRVGRRQEQVLHGRRPRADGQRPPAGLDAQRGGVLVVGGHGPGAPAAAAAQDAGDGRTAAAANRAGRSPRRRCRRSWTDHPRDRRTRAHIIDEPLTARPRPRSYGLLRTIRPAAPDPPRRADPPAGPTPSSPRWAVEDDGAGGAEERRACPSSGRRRPRRRSRVR